MSARAPLAAVRGLGSARQGSHHWWQQRITAVALLPLSLWFVYAVVALPGYTHADVTAWLRSSFNVVLLLLFIGALLHHAQLGIQTIIEDYVEPEWQKIASILMIRFIALLSGMAAALAVLKVFLGL